MYIYILNPPENPFNPLAPPDMTGLQNSLILGFMLPETRVRWDIFSQKIVISSQRDLSETLRGLGIASFPRQHPLISAILKNGFSLPPPPTP